MEKWTVILTIPMALLSAVGQINIFNFSGPTDRFHPSWPDLPAPDLLPTITPLAAMVAGTMFGIWLGQLISEYGIRNQGLSLIIFAGIVARMPTNLGPSVGDQYNWWWEMLVILTILVLDDLCHRVCTARTAQCARDVPRAAGWQPHVHAGAQQPAPDGQYGRHDPADLCPIHPDLPGHRGFSTS